MSDIVNGQRCPFYPPLRVEVDNPYYVDYSIVDARDNVIQIPPYNRGDAGSKKMAERKSRYLVDFFNKNYGRKEILNGVETNGTRQPIL